MKNGKLEGKLKVDVHPISTAKGHKDYALIFHKEDLPIARAFYHPCGQYTIESLDTCLSKETILKILRVMEKDTFRLCRRWCQSKQKAGER